MTNITAHLDKVIKLLDRRIKECRSEKIDRLPPIKVLAQEMGLSPKTVCKALAHLRQRGIVRVSQRQGIRIIPLGADSNPQPVITATPTLNLTLREHLLHDLLLGAFAGNEQLPTIKELTVRYGTGFLTLKKALQQLESEAIITKLGKRYTIASPALKQGRARLVVIAGIDQVSVLSRFTPQASEFWRLLERECSRRGISIEVQTFARACSLLSGKARKHDTRPVVGYLVLTYKVQFDLLHNSLLLLDKTALPVSVIDDIGEMTMPSITITSRHIRLFIMSTTSRPGTIMGNYLLRAGHRRSAYFGAFAGSTWSSNRWLGLQRTFADAGLPDQATLLAVDHTDEWSGLFIEHTGRRVLNKIEAALLDTPMIFDRSLVHKNHSFYTHLLPYIWNLRLASILMPQFERALNDPSITAWVAENDDVALLALQFLEEHAVRVPQKISVVGFDDTLEGLGQGLTSFNFNTAALLHASLNHILAPRAFQKSGIKGALEIQGIIMERKSCARPGI